MKAGKFWTGLTRFTGLGKGKKHDGISKFSKLTELLNLDMRNMKADEEESQMLVEVPLSSFPVLP